jgi:hypothetical protein
MKRIPTHSTLVSAKHGLVTNGKYTKTFDLQHSSQYDYKLDVQAPWALGCAGTCQMAIPTLLQFQHANPSPISLKMIGGFDSHVDRVVPSTPPSGGQQKIELDATISHQIGPIKLQDALSVRVV